MIHKEVISGREQESSVPRRGRDKPELHATEAHPMKKSL